MTQSGSNTLSNGWGGKPKRASEGKDKRSNCGWNSKGNVLLIDYVTFFLFPNFDTSIALFTGFGEQLLPLWLLIKGVNVEQWEKRALESA